MKYKMNLRSNLWYYNEKDDLVYIKKKDNPWIDENIDLAEYARIHYEGFSYANVSIVPYYSNGYLYFNIESDDPFNTILPSNEIRSEEIALDEAILNFINGQISDGWGENGVGTIHGYTVWAGNAK